MGEKRHSKNARRMRLASALLGAGLVAACSNLGGGDRVAASSCAALPAAFAGSTPEVRITSAVDIAGTANAPAYCEVRGSVRGNIRFAVFLPKEWNGRFQMVGNGGKAGTISLAAMGDAVRQGYATSSTDTGHDASIPAQAGARFGYDPEFGRDMQTDFGSRAVHLTARISKDIVQAYYPAKLQFSYWNGCSTGGRQGLIQAQRYPEDFDGYVIGAPVYNYTRQQMSAPALLQPLYPNGATGGSLLSQAKVDLVGRIVYDGNGTNFAGCDALDGVRDGQIRNPQMCRFDPAVHVPACGPQGGADCLTRQELAAVNAVYAGRPEFGVWPLPVGSEQVSGGWRDWLIAEAGKRPALHNVMSDAFEYLMFEPDRPGFDYLKQFDWRTDPFRMEAAKQTYNATNPDLRAVAQSGKKIILYHGWTDTGVNPMGTLEYRANVEALFGGRESVDRFMKLYMVPGLGHCSGGPGHGVVDWMAPLRDWVEKGAAPVEILGKKAADSSGSTRPHCPYPLEAIHDGRGDVNRAQSYACRLPG